MQKGVAFHVIIKFTGSAEDGTNAFKSVLSIASTDERLRHLIIVCGYYSDGHDFFPGSAQLIQEMRQKNIHVDIVSEFDKTNSLELRRGGVAIELSPMAKLKSGGVGKLDMAMREIDQSKKASLTHFGVQTMFYDPVRGSGVSWSQLREVFFGYGFLMVCNYFDFLWSIWSRGKYYETTDVHAHYISITRDRAHFAPTSYWTNRVWDNEQLPAKEGGEGAYIQPSPEMRGFNYVRWKIANHSHQTWGLWMAAFLFLYFLLAFPWWNFAQDLHFIAPIRIFGRVFYKKMTDPGAILIWCINLGLVYFSSYTQARLPHQALLCVLFPIYLSFYPLVWLYSKFYRPMKALEVRDD